MLSAVELTAARATQALTMTNTATIQRPTHASDGMGGTRTTWATVGTTACRTTAAGAQDSQLVAGQLRERASWRVTAPALTDIRTTDRLVIDGRTLEVVGVSAPATYETARVCICAEA